MLTTSGVQACHISGTNHTDWMYHAHVLIEQVPCNVRWVRNRDKAMEHGHEPSCPYCFLYIHNNLVTRLWVDSSEMTRHCSAL
jgi:hypothetical protein